MKKLKPLPIFKNEDETRKFWANHDLVDYFDANKALVNPALSKTFNKNNYNTGD